MKREHKWNKEDAIITLFYVKHGTKGLLVTNEKELAESVIGSSLESLKMMSLNFNHLMGLENSFCHYSDHQEKVYNEYCKFEFSDFKDVVNKIILNRDLAKNKNDFKEAKKIRDAKLEIKNAAKKRQQDLADIFIMMGRDPKKMRKI